MNKLSALTLAAALISASAASAETTKIGLDNFDAAFPSATATIEPHPMNGAPAGSTWMVVYLFSFPSFTAEEQNLIATGRAKRIEQTRLSRSAAGTTEGDFAAAQLVLSLDDKNNPWQADLAVQLSHDDKLTGCAVAETAPGPGHNDIKNFFKEYKFDGQNLSLKAVGSYDCTINSRTYKFNWNVALDNVSVVKKP